eukprot:COSAG01_NODE_608_length_14865_cov_5.517879_1_plen_68_part_10
MVQEQAKPTYQAPRAPADSQQGPKLRRALNSEALRSCWLLPGLAAAWLPACRTPYIGSLTVLCLYTHR